MSGGGFDPGAAFSPRPVRPGAPIEIRGWRLKTYTITLPGESIDEGAYERGLVLAADKLPEPAIAARRPGVGFIIRHQGLDAQRDRVHYLVACWWDNANELFIETFMNGGATGGAWINARLVGSVCVWDLEVIWHERGAFVRHMLAHTPPDPDAYLADLLSVST